MTRQYGFARISDKDVMSLCCEIATLHPQGRAIFNVVDNVSFTVVAAAEVPNEWSELLDQKSYLIQTATAAVEAAGIMVTYYRGCVFRFQNGGSGWWPSDNPYLDGIEVQGPSQSPAEYGPALIQILAKFLRMAPPLEVAEISSNSVQKSEVILDRMSGAVATLTEQAAIAFRKIEDRKTEIEGEAQRSASELREKLSAEFAQKTADLSEKQARLDAKLADIDANDNTYTRRAVAVNMRSLSENFLGSGLLDKSKAASTLPIAVSIAGSAVFGLLAYLSASSLIDLLGKAAPSHAVAIPSGVYYFFEARTAVLGAGAAALFWFALRMLNSRYRQVAKWENDLNRFRLDTERASFLVEGDLEARKLSGQPLPQVVLESFSRGLFGTSGEGEASGNDGVGSALSSILNRPASLKVSGNGVEVTVDKGGLAKARKEIDGDSKGD